MANAINHNIPHEAKGEHCLVCGEQATHVLTETVWQKSGGSETGIICAFYFCCVHFVELVEKSGGSAENAKRLCGVS